MKPSAPFSRVVLVLLFLAIGYFPFGLAILSSVLSNLSGGGPMDTLWDAETYVWGLILLPFQILAIVVTATLFKARKFFASGAVIAALFGISMYAYNFSPDFLKQDSTAGDGHLHLFRFWVDGGGWLAAFIVGPLLIWYLYLRFRERRAHRPLTTVQA